MKRNYGKSVPLSWLHFCCTLWLLLGSAVGVYAQTTATKSNYIRATDKVGGQVDMENAYWFTVQLKSSGKYLKASSANNSVSLVNESEAKQANGSIDPYAEWAFVFEQQTGYNHPVNGWQTRYLYRFVNRGKGASLVLRAGDGWRGERVPQMLAPLADGSRNGMGFAFNMHDATTDQAERNTEVYLGGTVAPDGDNNFYNFNGTRMRFLTNVVSGTDGIWVFRVGSLPGSCIEAKARSYIHSAGLAGGVQSSAVSTLASAYQQYQTDREYSLTIREQIDALDAMSKLSDPASGKYYRIRNGHFGFYKNSKKSVIIANANGTVSWGQRSENDANQVWKIEGDGANRKLVNLGTGQKLNFANGTTTAAGATVTITAINCAPGHYKIVVNNQVLHAAGHSGGTSNTGTMANFTFTQGGSKGAYDFDDPNGSPYLDAASAWMFEEVPQNKVTELSRLTDVQEAEVQSWLAPIGVVHGFTTSNQQYRNLLAAWVAYKSGNGGSKDAVLTAMNALKNHYNASSTSKVAFSLEGVYYIRNGSFKDLGHSTVTERSRLISYSNNQLAWFLHTRDFPTTDVAPSAWTTTDDDDKWLVKRNPSNQGQYSFRNIASGKYLSTNNAVSDTEVWLTLQQVQNAFFALKNGSNFFHAVHWMDVTTRSGNLAFWEKDDSNNDLHLYSNNQKLLASGSSWFLEPAPITDLTNAEKAQIMAFLANTRVVHGFVDPAATNDLRRLYTTVTATDWGTQPLAKRSADLYRLREEMQRIKEKYNNEKNDATKVVQWDPSKVYRLRNGGVERWAETQKYYAFVNNSNVPKAHLAAEIPANNTNVDDAELWIIVGNGSDGMQKFMNVKTGEYLSTATTTAFESVEHDTKFYKDDDYPGYYRIKMQNQPLHALSRDVSEISLGYWTVDNNDRDFHNGDTWNPLNSGSTWLYEPVSAVSPLTATEITMAKAFMGAVGVVDGFKNTNNEVTQLAAAYRAWVTNQNDPANRAKVRAWVTRTKELYHMPTTEKLAFEDGGVYLIRNGSLNAMVNDPIVERVVAHLPNEIQWQRLNSTPVDAQKWIVRRNSGGNYSFQNLSTGKYFAGAGTVSATPVWLPLSRIGRTMSGNVATDTYPAYFGINNIHARDWPNLTQVSANLTDHLKDGSDPNYVHFYENNQAVRHSASSWQLKPAPFRTLTNDEYRKAKLYAWAEGIVGGFYSCDVSPLRTLLGITSASPAPKTLATLTDKEESAVYAEVNRLSSNTTQRIPFVSGGYYHIRNMKEGFLEQGVQAMIYEYHSETPSEGRRPRWKRATNPATDASTIWRITGDVGGTARVQLANFSSGTYMIGLTPTPMFPTDQGYCQVLYINPTEAPGRVRLFLGTGPDPRKPHPDRHNTSDSEGRLVSWNLTSYAEPDKYNNSTEVRDITNEPITESSSSWALVPVDTKNCSSDQTQVTPLPVLTEQMKTHVKDYLHSEGYVNGYTTAQLAALKSSFANGNGDARATFEALMQVKTLVPIAFDPAKLYRLHRASRTVSNRNQVLYVDYERNKNKTTALNQPKVHVSDASLVSEIWKVSALGNGAKISNPNHKTSLYISGTGAMSGTGSGNIAELQQAIHPGMYYLNFSGNLSYSSVDAQLATASTSTSRQASNDIYAYSGGVGSNSYFFTDNAVWYLKEVTEIQLKAAGKKMVSLYYPFALELQTQPSTTREGSLWLYGVGNETTDRLTITPTNNRIIPANTPMFIEQSAPANLTLRIAYGQPAQSASSSGSVYGVLAPEAIKKGNYILQNKVENGATKFGFYLTSKDGYTPANKVYLAIRPATSSATAAPLVVDIERLFATTSIAETPILEEPETDEVYYNLLGKRVTNPSRHIHHLKRQKSVYSLKK